MAIDATTVWEMRTTGSNTNGGGFTDLNPGTSVDYSQQAAAQLTVTDAATSGIGVTTLTSATGGFTAAMEGNVIHLSSGTNLTDGWYQITGYTNTNTVALDRAPDDGVGGVSGATDNVGGAVALPTEAFGEQLVAGHKVWVQNGTFTLTGAFNIIADGTAALPIVWEGYNVSRGDAPTGADRPTFACAANVFYTDNYWHFYNFQWTTTETSGARVDNNSLWKNCKSTNSSGTSGRIAFRCVTANTILDCEAVSTNGYGLFISGSNTVWGCYVHDSDIGVGFQASTCNILFSIFDTCATVAITGTADTNMLIANNTVYNSGVGIRDTATGGFWRVINNTISDCTTGISWGTEQLSNHFDWNNYWSNGTDVSNATKGPNATAINPDYTDAAGGDFSRSTADLDGGAFSIDLGNDGASSLDQGAWQSVSGGGGGGLLVHPGMSGGMRA